MKITTSKKKKRDFYATFSSSFSCFFWNHFQICKYLFDIFFARRQKQITTTYGSIFSIALLSKQKSSKLNFGCNNRTANFVLNKYKLCMHACVCVCVSFQQIQIHMVTTLNMWSCDVWRAVYCIYLLCSTTKF